MARLRRFRLPCDFPRENDREWTQMGYLLGQKQRKQQRPHSRGAMGQNVRQELVAVVPVAGAITRAV
jgi:hypothetical protein